MVYLETCLELFTKIHIAWQPLTNYSQKKKAAAFTES